MKVTMTEWPTEHDWMEAYRRALVTVGKRAIRPPTFEWKKQQLRARHSTIRRLRFAFEFEDVPTWVSVHLARHVHAQPYVKSQRNDRQSEYDRNKAPQDAPVNMIWDMNAEEFLTITNKRLCNLAAQETREAIQMCVDLVKETCPEFIDEMVPMCVYHGGVCHEMFSCKK